MSSISLLDVAIQQMVEITGAGHRWCRTSQMQDFVDYVETAMNCKQIQASKKAFRSVQLNIIDQTRLVSRTVMKTNGEYGELTSFLFHLRNYQEYGKKVGMLGTHIPSFYLSKKVLMKKYF